MVYSGAWRKLIHEKKNLKSTISWHCPFNGIAAGEESQAVAGGVLNSPSSSTTSSQVALQMDDILGDFPHRYVLVSDPFFLLSLSPHSIFPAFFYMSLVILLKHHLHEIYCHDINVIFEGFFRLLQCVISG